jgi:hypothetical protein
MVVKRGTAPRSMVFFGWEPILSSDVREWACAVPLPISSAAMGQHLEI